MIDGASRHAVTESLLRLVGLPSTTIESILIRRGIDPSSLDEAKEAITAVGVPMDANEALAYPFKRRDSPAPYSSGRFGDGQYPVFYSALDEGTCIAEIKHHLQPSFELLSSSQFPHPRYYHILQCNFVGSTMVLLGCEQQYPELVSPTESGYTFCRDVARWSILEGAEALHTASARNVGGTCVPVFAQATLSNARAEARIRFMLSDGQLTSEKIS